MGQAKNKRALKKEFFYRNPVCCFCGGQNPATTEDHWPPRCLFRERKWPEGYVFPACSSCNSSTRTDENLLSMVFRISTSPGDELDQTEFRKALNAVRNNFPGVFEEMKLGNFKKRAALKSHGIPRLAGVTLAETPVVGLPTVARAAIERFSFKLGCALHYKHVGTCLPRDGRIVHQFQTTAMLYSNPIAEEVLRLTPEFAVLQRGNQKLDSQFIYRYGFSNKIDTGLFVCLLRKSFSILVITTGKPEILEGYKLDGDNIGGIGIGDYLRCHIERRKL